MISTNMAEPMDPAMVRREVSREEASATLRASTLPVPHVSRGIIRLPMEMLRSTLSPAATHSGMLVRRKNITRLLRTSAAEPAMKRDLMPILSYSLPANGLTTAVAREPGSVTSPETTAEQPMTLWTYSGIITEEPIITR